MDLSDENIFLVASACKPGKNIDLNEGLRFLCGKAKIVLPLKKKPEPPKPAEPAAPAVVAAAAAPAAPVFSGPVTSTVRVVEGGVVRSFRVTIEPPAGGTSPAPGSAPAPAAAAAPSRNGTPVFSPFDGKSELVEVNVKVGDMVARGQVVAAVEAMKAKHDVKAPTAGKVLSIDAGLGDDVMAGMPILTIGS